MQQPPRAPNSCSQEHPEEAVIVQRGAADGDAGKKNRSEPAMRATVSSANGLPTPDPNANACVLKPPGQPLTRCGNQLPSDAPPPEPTPWRATLQAPT